MLVYDLNTIDFVEKPEEEMNIIECNIEVKNFLNKSFRELSADLQNQINIDNLIDNSYIKIYCKNDENLTQEDENQIYDSVISILLNKISLNKPRDRENRLTANMDGIHSCYMPWLKTINTATSVNCFGVEVKFNDNQAIKLFEV